MNNFSSAEKIAEYIVGKCVKNKIPIKEIINYMGRYLK